MYDLNKLSSVNDSTWQNQTTSRSNQIAVLKNAYIWMSLALIVSGLTAMVVAQNPAILGFIFGSRLSFMLVFLVQFGLIWIISSRINSMSFSTATLLFLLYSILIGVTLSTIFLTFTQESIASVFFITAGTFGGISLYGYTTQKDLSTWGGYLLMALIGLILASVVNWFMQSEILYWITSYAGVLIFVGLTAYDTQKIKQLVYQYGNENTETTQKVALLGAITLYLDFINLFLYLLRIFGKKK